MKWLKKQFVYALSCAIVLSGCVTNNSGPNAGNVGAIVGPQLSSLFDLKRDAIIDEDKHKLDVIIPVFDPGLLDDDGKELATSSQGDPFAPDEPKGSPSEQIWPELRRAEANRFAYQLKKAMDATGAFGAVRVTPDQTATGDLYVLGEILESNGEDVEIAIDVLDISGKSWFTRTFDHEVDPAFHKTIRNDGLDPYTPVFEKAANRIALELEEYTTEQLEQLAQLAELRFGASMSEDAFTEHLKFEDGTVSLASRPSDDDPMLNRTRAVRVRDQLFVDSLQEEYRTFNDRMAPSYMIWQEQSLAEIEARRAAQQKAAGQAALGVLAFGLAVLAAAAGARSNSSGGQGAGAVGAIAAGAIGASLIGESFQTSKEAEVHRDSLNELGESINVDLGPRVVEFEQQTLNLTGDAKEQFAKWRAFLQKIYLQEKTQEKKMF